MNESLTFIHGFDHFMKWIAKYTGICPFHEVDSWVVHFMKWTISHLSHNICIILIMYYYVFAWKWLLEGSILQMMVILLKLLPMNLI